MGLYIGNMNKRYKHFKECIWNFDFLSRKKTNTHIQQQNPIWPHELHVENTKPQIADILVEDLYDYLYTWRRERNLTWYLMTMPERPACQWLV